MTTDWDSDEYDREVRRLRVASKPLRPKEDEPGTTRNAAYGPARGWATAAELRRRQQAALLMNGKPTTSPVRPGRWPQPRATASGRWLAVVKQDGQRYRAVFDTREEAEQFIEQIKGGR